MQASPNIVGDTIPVDIVVANILVASAFNARSHTMTVYNCGSSDRNPILWGVVRDIVEDFWNTNISQNRVSKSKITYSSNPLVIRTSELMRTIPISVYSRIAPFMGSQHVKNAQKLVKAEERAA